MKRAELKPSASGIFEVPVDLIDIPQDRLRTLKPAQAEAIGKAIAADRQYDAITLAQLPGQDRLVLIDGLHRLVGCRGEGLATIEARIVAGDRDQRRRQEIISTWARAGEDVFDRAAAIAYLAKIAGDDESAIIALGVDWGDDAAEALGVSRRTIFNYLKISRFYTAPQIAALRAANLAEELVPLLRLAALPPEDFVRAWQRIEAGENIAAALAFVAPAPVDPIATVKAGFLKKVDAWPAMERKRLMAELRERYDAQGEPKVR